MSKNSGIQWTHHTFNPWWGCWKKSPGCANCYADDQATRFGFEVWGKNAPRRFFSEKHWSEPVNWNKQAEKEGKRHRVFCASMADVFEGRPDLDADFLRLMDLIRHTPWLDWLLLTKRPENIEGCVLGTARMAALSDQRDLAAWLRRWMVGLHPDNVWVGATVENQAMADERCHIINQIPAKHTFLSCEPLLEPVELRLEQHGNIDWVIIGGESGRRARPFAVDWARKIIDQCRLNNVPPFMKQLGEKHQGVDGEFITISSKKGDDMSEWPIDIRHREFPVGVTP